MWSAGFWPHTIDPNVETAGFLAHVAWTCEGQSLEHGPFPDGIDPAQNPLDPGGYGSIYAPDHRLWCAGGRSRWHSSVPHVQPGHLRVGAAYAAQHRSCSAVPVPP